MSESNKEAVLDMAKAIQKEMKKWPFNRRKGVWKTITSEKGEEMVKKIIQDPNRTVADFKNLSFKEWLSL